MLLRIATALGALPLLLLALAGPAAAQTVSITDPRGDDRPRAYDIHRLTLKHADDTVRVELRQDRTPYWYEIRVDTPRTRNYEYVVYWSAYYPKFVHVFTRRGYEHGFHGKVCSRRTAHYRHAPLGLSFPRSCLKGPAAIRMKAIAWDDERGATDHTRWTPWVRRG